MWRSVYVLSSIPRGRGLWSLVFLSILRILTYTDYRFVNQAVHGSRPHPAQGLRPPPIFDFRVACLFSSPYHTEHTEYTVHPHSYRERDGRLASVVLGLDPEV